jgi:hypothetical protein
VLQVLPESVVAKMMPPSSELFSPAAKQVLADVQAIPFRYLAPESTVWVVQVLPELVVARMMPPSFELFTPTA